MNRRTMRRGYTVLDVLAGVAVVAMGVSVMAVNGGAAPGAQPEKKKDSAKATPSDKDNAELLELIRNMHQELKGMKDRMQILEDQMGAIEGRLEARNPGARANARAFKDSSQVRGIIQGMIIWANNTKNSYPFPSDYDTKDATVAGPPASKNTSSAVFSLLVFNGFIPVDLCVSPMEQNPNIKPYDRYEFNEPKAARSPKEALWDPAFPVDFTGGRVGALSYAHLQPSKGRRAEWANTFNTMTGVVGNRGPEIKSVAYPEKGNPQPQLAKADSYTLRMYPPDESWEGNIGYNDGHVNFEKRMVSSNMNEWPTLLRKDGLRVGDCIFYDEPEDKDGRNIFLGIFTASGEKPEDWKSIWD